MKPFHSALGAFSWVEQYANGTAVSVLVVQPVSKWSIQLKTVAATYEFREQQWQLVSVVKVANGTRKVSPYPYPAAN